MVAQPPCRGGVHRPQQALNVLPRQRAARAFELRLNRRDHGVGQIDGDARRGEQEAGKGTDAAGDIGHGGTCISLRALDQELVDVRQRHRAPGLAAVGEMSRELADMVQLLIDGRRRIAPITGEVLGILLQKRRYGRRWQASRPAMPAGKAPSPDTRG